MKKEYRTIFKIQPFMEFYAKSKLLEGHVVIPSLVSLYILNYAHTLLGIYGSDIINSNNLVYCVILCDNIITTSLL